MAFEAVLRRPHAPGALAYLDVPFAVEAAFGRKGRVAVRGTIDGSPFRRQA